MTTQDYSPTAASNTALIAPDGTQIPLGEGQTLPKHVNDASSGALMADTPYAAKLSGAAQGAPQASRSNWSPTRTAPVPGGRRQQVGT